MGDNTNVAAAEEAAIQLVSSASGRTKKFLL